jgi:hypothetical protein
VAILDSIKSQMQKLKAEYKTKRGEILGQIRALEKSLEQLDAQYGALISIPGRLGRKAARRNGRQPSALAYGGVRTAVLEAIKSGKGLKPKQIVEKTGLGGPPGAQFAHGAQEVEGRQGQGRPLFRRVKPTRTASCGSAERYAA